MQDTATLTLAHELRDLIQALLSALEILQTRIAPEHRDLVERMLTTADAAARLARSGLLLGADAGPMAVLLPASLVEIADEIRRLHGAGTRPVAVRVEAVEAGQVCRARADRRGLLIVLLHLVRNAAQAIMAREKAVAPALVTGEIAIVISMRMVCLLPSAAADLGVATGDYCGVQVRDTGISMDPGQITQVAGGGRIATAKEGGSGLGLMIVQTVVKEWGGALRFESVPGEGTTAEVFLPLAADV